MGAHASATRAACRLLLIALSVSLAPPTSSLRLDAPSARSPPVFKAAAAAATAPTDTTPRHASHQPGRSHCGCDRCSQTAAQPLRAAWASQEPAGRAGARAGRPTSGRASRRRREPRFRLHASGPVWSGRRIPRGARSWRGASAVGDSCLVPSAPVGAQFLNSSPPPWASRPPHPPAARWTPTWRRACWSGGRFTIRR